MQNPALSVEMSTGFSKEGTYGGGMLVKYKTVSCFQRHLQDSVWVLDETTQEYGSTG